MADGEFNLESFMKRYGNLLTEAFRKELNKKYMYSPGFSGRAYASKGKDGDTWRARKKRNRDYAGTAPKSPFGSNLSNSIETVWDDQMQTLGILMADYWQVVDEGRQPGKWAPIQPIKDWLNKPNINLPQEAAFAIQKNIYKFGIRPTGFYGRAVDKIASKIEKDFGDDFDTYLDTFLDTLLEPQLRQRT